MKKTIILFLLMIITLGAYSQNTEVIVKVFSSDSLIMGSNLKTSKSKQEVSSDVNGIAHILVAPKDKIKINNIGYRYVEVSVQNPQQGDTIKVDLTKFKIELSNNSKTINEEFSNYDNIYSLISAKVFQVDRRSGNCFVDKHSAEAGCAVFVVDGVQNSDVSYILPIEVASITFLRGSQASVYGFEASKYGAIFIKTLGEQNREDFKNTTKE